MKTGTLTNHILRNELNGTPAGETTKFNLFDVKPVVVDGKKTGVYRVFRFETFIGEVNSKTQFKSLYKGLTNKTLPIK